MLPRPTMRTRSINTEPSKDFQTHFPTLLRMKLATRCPISSNRRRNQMTAIHTIGNAMHQVRGHSQEGVHEIRSFTWTVILQQGSSPPVSYTHLTLPTN